MLMPQEALNSVKCSLCNNFLSYFPIYMGENNQPICGRCCELLTDNNFTRATLFEQLAQFFKFPCIYHAQGCIENLIPDEVPSHEENCPYKIIACSQECMWQGNVQELLDHFQESHPNAILRDGEFEINFINSYETFNLVTYKDELFSFRRTFNYEENILKCSVFCYKMLDSVTNYKYKIVIQNGTRTHTVKFAPKPANGFSEQNTTEIKVESIRNKLNDPSIIVGTLKILDEKETTPAKKKPNAEINLEILNELECPVCFHYIIPPIFQCVTGHSICGDCKTKVSQCPLCQQEIKNTQNFTLEKMAFLLTYPCLYVENGCDFVAKPGQIKQHQKYCPFGTQLCPLEKYEDCDWKGPSKDMYKHIQKSHHDNMLEIDTVRVFVDGDYFENEEDICYIMKFSDALFKLHYYYGNMRFHWAVQFIGPPEQAKNYKFEIDICDNTSNDLKMFLRNFCATFKDKDESFEEGGQYVFLNLDQIRPFLTDMLTYRVRIVK